MGYVITFDENTCLECGIEIAGRRGRKFCCVNCKNHYNNRRNTQILRYRKDILNKLSRNRDILENFLRINQTSISLDVLNQMGFDETYFTRCQFSKPHTEYYCFDVIYSLSNLKLFGLHYDSTKL